MCLLGLSSPEVLLTTVLCVLHWAFFSFFFLSRTGAALHGTGGDGTLQEPSLLRQGEEGDGGVVQGLLQPVHSRGAPRGCAEERPHDAEIASQALPVLAIRRSIADHNTIALLYNH